MHPQRVVRQPAWEVDRRQNSPWRDHSDQFPSDSQIMRPARHASSSMLIYPDWTVVPQGDLCYSGPQTNGSMNMVSSIPHYLTPCDDPPASLSSSSYYPDPCIHLPSTHITPSPTYMMNDDHQYPYPYPTVRYPLNTSHQYEHPIVRYPRETATSVTTRCQWANCNIELDDTSHAGIRRHFRQSHHTTRGARTRCEWGRMCRTEPMLYENIPKHIAECHLKTMAIMCPTCNNLFARKDTLKRHTTAGCPSTMHT